MELVVNDDDRTLVSQYKPTAKGLEVPSGHLVEEH